MIPRICGQCRHSRVRSCRSARQTCLYWKVNTGPTIADGSIKLFPDGQESYTARDELAGQGCGGFGCGVAGGRGRGGSIITPALMDRN
jgi:hypothetical protein